MALTKFQELDVLYDSKQEGDVIDSSEWNDNFGEIESITNANKDAFNSFVDEIETNASNSFTLPAINTGGSTKLGGQLGELKTACDNLKVVTDKFNGISSVASTITNDATKIPTSKAVFDASHNHTNKSVLDLITGIKTNTTSINPNTDIASITALTGAITALQTTLTTLINSTKTELQGDIEEIVIEAGAGDMTKNTYDSNNDGVVNKADEATNLTGLTTTIAELNALDGITATTAELNVLDGITATTTELNYVDGVTSNIQTQLNAKLEDEDISGLANKSSVITKTVAIADWSLGATVYTCTLNDDAFVNTGYSYIVSPSATSLSEYAECEIKALDVTTNGSLVLEANDCPENQITITILKIQIS